MATEAYQGLEPDRVAIERHINALFDPVSWVYPGGLIEIAYGQDKPNQAMLFALDPASRQRAVDWACKRNAAGENVYVGVNPRKPTARQAQRADASGVEIAFFHFADLDDADAVARARQNLPLKPTMIVMTGTQPNNRPHFYWELEEPTINMQAWGDQQRAIALALGGDAVIDPPRIMRLGGTVNYPPPHKRERGYAVERGTVRTEFTDERPPFEPAAVAQAFPPVASNVVSISATAQSGQTTLQAMNGRTRVADLIEACQRGDQWHNNMARLTAHMASVGRSNAEIIGLAAGITLPGYTVEQTAREMSKAIEGARNKWALPEPEDTIETEEAEREEGDSIFELLDLDELESLPPPTWLIENLIADHGLSIVYGEPGSGKSFIVLDMALRIAFGMDWHGTPANTCGVLYIAGEGSRGLGNRVKGWRREHALEGAEAPFLLLPVAVQMMDPKSRAKLLRTIDAAKARAGFPIGLTIIDTVSRSMPGTNENSQESMSTFVDGCGEIQTHTGGAVIGVHHDGKDSTKGMRGSTVLLGACDASLKISKSEEQRVAIKIEKQKDAEEADTIYMNLKKLEWATGLGKEESTLVPVREESAVTAEVRSMLSRGQISSIFDTIEAAWLAKKPYSVSPNTRAQGRYMPRFISAEYGVKESIAKQFLSDWLMRDFLTTDTVDTNTKAKGLRVLKRIDL